MTSGSNQIKEYKFDSRTEVEAKLRKILETKLNIGYEFINENIDPVFYNQFNGAMKGFDAMFKNEQGIHWRFDRILDSEQNSFKRVYSETDIKYLHESYGDFENLIHLYSTFQSFNFQIELNRHGMQYIYRFDLDPWDQMIWKNDEPRDKLTSVLGKSILDFITAQDSQKKNNLWTKVYQKFKGTSYPQKRFYFFTKGIFSILDAHTEKIYSAQEYEPRYDRPLKSSDIITHDNTVVFMDYLWNRLTEDIFYSMEYR